MNSKGKHKRRKIRSEDKKCLFCSNSEREIYKFGQMYKYNDIYVHYFCLLLSSGLVQKGKDTEGIFGFLEEDIIKEFRRGEKLKCYYCKGIGATIGCSVKTCKVTFHLDCGQQNSALNQFFQRFDSFCVKHRPRQTLDSSNEVNEKCPTCYSKVHFDEGFQVLTTPCCHKLCHRTCLQKQALSAGYFFKCPLCNNKHQFIQTMNDFGIYLPKQDASWEMDNNAFGELYQRYQRCDQNNCLCPEGRQYHSEGKWQLLICATCGSKGTHWKCVGRSDWIDAWNCNDCEAVEQRVSNQSKHLNDVHSDDDSESDIEVKVVSRNSNKMMSTIKLSNDSNQLFEINVFDDISEKKVKRLKKPEMKDVSIQCTLVDAKDLIDSEPKDEFESRFLKNYNISISSFNAEVIDIDDSDDDIIFLD